MNAVELLEMGIREGGGGGGRGSASSNHIDSALFRYLEEKITATKYQLLIITEFVRYAILSIESFLIPVYKEIDAW